MDQAYAIVQFLAVAALPFIFAITLHEAAHGWVASKLGDPTARVLGRLSLNPLRHIDWVGTVLVPVMMMLLVKFFFGWAKPVPVNMRNLPHPRRDMAIVAAAGPLANLLMAALWALLLKLALVLGEHAPWAATPLAYMGALGVWLNLILMVLNLLPIPPLDGGRVLSGLVPPRFADKLDRIEPYGIFIVLGLFVLGVLQYVLWPALMLATTLLQLLFGLPEVFPIVRALFASLSA
jgi:Zn-dependent protease